MLDVGGVGGARGVADAPRRLLLHLEVVNLQQAFTSAKRVEEFVNWIWV